MNGTLANALAVIGREAARIAMPSWCVVCEKELAWRDRNASACRSCWRALPRISGAKCSSCALPLVGSGEPRCLSCLGDPLPLEWCDAWGHYRGGLEKVLHAFKFKRHDFLDASLAALLESTLQSRRDLRFDAVVAVPMSRSKQRRRGYNQAELLARALAARIAVPYDGLLLVTLQERQRQSTLPRDQRASNVRRAFSSPPSAKDKSILIVDDICTTGETLRACARELVRARAGRVCAVAVAKVS